MFSRVREAATRRGRKAPAVAAFTLLLGLLASHPAFATSVKRLGLGEIVGAADAIVQGRVDAIRCFWQDRQIYTEVRVAVTHSLKGPRQDRLTFLQGGGRVDSR